MCELTKKQPTPAPIPTDLINFDSQKVKLMCLDIQIYQHRINKGERFYINRSKSVPDSLAAPSHRIQTEMPPNKAVACQAALILEGKRRLLSVSQTKLDKASRPNIGLTLSPHKEAKRFLPGINTCKGAVPSCIFACVGAKCGQGTLRTSEIARIGRTVALFLHYEHTFRLIVDEAQKVITRASKKGLRVAFRVNVASDLAWLAGALAAVLNCDFYDYTAVPEHLELRDGVRRILSYKGNNMPDIMTALSRGHGVAIVADIGKDDPKPKTWRGYPAIDGDLDDLWIDRIPANHEGFVVFLYLKGNRKQKHESRRSGFALSREELTP